MVNLSLPEGFYQIISFFSALFPENLRKPGFFLRRFPFFGHKTSKKWLFDSISPKVLGLIGENRGEGGTTYQYEIM